MVDWFVPILLRPRRGVVASFVDLLSEVWGKLFDLAVIQDESSELTQLCDTIIHTGKEEREGNGRERRKGGKRRSEGERWKEENEGEGRREREERL